MTKLPQVSSQNLIKALLKAGCSYAPVKGKGSHTALLRIDSNNTKHLIIIPKRDPIPKGTLLSIIKQSGYSKEEFFEKVKIK